MHGSPPSTQSLVKCDEIQQYQRLTLRELLLRGKQLALGIDYRQIVAQSLGVEFACQAGRIAAPALGLPELFAALSLATRGAECILHFGQGLQYGVLVNDLSLIKPCVLNLDVGSNAAPGEYRQAQGRSQ